MRIVAICILGFSTAAAAKPRPITEVDVYREMAELFVLAGLDQSIMVRTAGGMQDDRWLGGVEVAYRHDWRNWRELLPNTFGIGASTEGVPLSIGYTFVLGFSSAPYVTANALAMWEPSTSQLALGFDAGVGYEHRISIRWAATADLRVQWLSPVVDDRMRESAWGARATLGVRRYFD